MDKEQVIALARDAGFADGVVEIVGLEGFARFAELVAAAERTKCLKIADECADADMHASMVANGIRARGNT